MLDPRTTALILIDLQQGIVPHAGGPRSGDAVVETAKALAQRFRDAGAPVILVHVGFTPETSFHLHVSNVLPMPPLSRSSSRCFASSPPSEYSDLATTLSSEAGIVSPSPPSDASNIAGDGSPEDMPEASVVRRPS